MRKVANKRCLYSQIQVEYSQIVKINFHYFLTSVIYIKEYCVTLKKGFVEAVSKSAAPTQHIAPSFPQLHTHTLFLPCTQKRHAHTYIHILECASLLFKHVMDME